MSTPPTITSGTKVTTGEPGTPGFKEGVVVGIGTAKELGRNEDEDSALVAWESGEQEWAELSTLRVAGDPS